LKNLDNNIIYYSDCSFAGEEDLAVLTRRLKKRNSKKKRIRVKFLIFATEKQNKIIIISSISEALNQK